MAQAARARTKTPSVNINMKLVEKFLREAIGAYHPKSGDLGAAVKTMKLKNITAGVALVWEDQTFLITATPETP